MAVAEVPMQDAESNQSKPTDEHSMAPPSRDQADLTEVVFDRNMTDMLAMIGLTTLVVIVGGIFVALLVVFLPTVAAAPVIKVMGGFAAAGSFATVILVSLRKRGLASVRRVLGESPDSPIEARIARILTITRGVHPQSLVKEVVKTLAAEGRFGTTIRIVPDRRIPIVPISVPFEPRRFDDVAEVESVKPRDAEPGTEDPGGAQPGRGPAANPAAVPRGIRRNLILKGGWFLLAVIGVNWVGNAIESLMRRTITPGFVAMTVALLGLLLLPVGHNWITGRQWLAVPAGIVLRKGAWLKRRWDLHLYRRRASVLLVYKLFRRQWMLVVADRDACDSVMGTEQELDAVLRAWLSPLSPPTLEQLGDLR